MIEKIPTLKSEHKDLTALRKEKSDAEKKASAERAIVKTITMHLKPLSEDILRLTCASIRVDKQLEKQIERIDNIDVKVLDRFLTRTSNLVISLESRVKDLDKMYQFMIHKETVLTEVSMYARSFQDWALIAQFHMAIMKAYNKDNDWWHERRELASDKKEMTVKDWYFRIMALLDEPAMEYGRADNAII